MHLRFAALSGKSYLRPEQITGQGGPVLPATAANDCLKRSGPVARQLHVYERMSVPQRSTRESSPSFRLEPVEQQGRSLTVSFHSIIGRRPIRLPGGNSPAPDGGDDTRPELVPATGLLLGALISAGFWLAMTLIILIV